ncbi:MAG: HEAT repeat domain-containing protein [Planctomycetota bacterium]|nr:HEAT repeat domain-containing protein [Planctomycetota bacterium]
MRKRNGLPLLVLAGLLAGCGDGGKPPEAASARELEQARAEIAALKEQLAAVQAQNAGTGEKLERAAVALKQLGEQVDGLAGGGKQEGLTDTALYELLNSGDGELVRAAAAVIRRYPTPPRLRALAQTARDLKQPFNARWGAIEYLLTIEDPALQEACVALLDDPQSSVVSRAAAVLGRTQAPRHLPPLLKALKESVRFEDQNKVWEAQRGLLAALGALGDKQAAPALLEALKSENDDVVRTAAQALRQLKEPSAGAALLEALKELPPPDTREHPRVHIDLVQALGGLQAHTAGPYFVELLRAPNAALRAQVAQQLPLVCGPDAASALSDALRGEWAAVRGGAQGDTAVLEQLIRALGATRSPRGLPALLELLAQGLNGKPAEEAALVLPSLATPAQTAALVEAYPRVSFAPAQAALAKLLGSAGYPAAWDEAGKKFVLDPKKALPAAAPEPAGKTEGRKTGETF